MFLRTLPISVKDKLNFAPLINKGVRIEIVIFEDPNGKFEYPVYLATYNGKPCHFHYTHSENNNQLNATINDVSNFLDI